MTHGLRSAAALVLGATLVARAASAQSANTDPTTARADALFRAASQLRAAGAYDQACPMFAEVEQMAPGVGIMLHLGACYESMGRPAEAWGEYHKAEELARQHHDRRALVARRRLNALEPKLRSASSRSTDTGSPAAQAPLPQSTNAGGQVEIAPLSSPTPPASAATPPAQPVAPAGSTPQSSGAQAPSVAPTVPMAPSVAPSADTPAVPAGANASAAAAFHLAELGLLGGGAAALGIGGTLLAYHDHQLSRGADLSGSLTASEVAFAAGGAAVITSVVLYLVGPAAKQTGWTLTPTPLVGGAGAVVDGVF